MLHTQPDPRRVVSCSMHRGQNRAGSRWTCVSLPCLVPRTSTRVSLRGTDRLHHRCAALLLSHHAVYISRGEGGGVLQRDRPMRGGGVSCSVIRTSFRNHGLTLYFTVYALTIHLTVLTIYYMRKRYIFYIVYNFFLFSFFVLNFLIYTVYILDYIYSIYIYIYTYIQYIYF